MATDSIPDVSQITEAETQNTEHVASSPQELSPKQPSLQELLKLPEHQVEEPPFEQKFDRIMEYSKEKATKSDSHFFQKDYRAQEQEEQLGSMTRKELSLMEKAQRKWASFKMKQAGIQDPNAIIQFLEKNTDSVAYDQIPSKDIAKLLKHLDIDNQEHAMEKLQIAFERFHKMALYPSQSNFTSEDFVDWVQISADAPEEVFEKVITDLDPYGFIYRSNWLTEGEDTDMLFDIIEAGGLTNEQKELLDKEQIWAQTAGDYSLENGLFYLHTALSPQMSSRLDSHMPYIVDFADHVLTTKENVDTATHDDQANLVSSNFIRNLDFLEKNGALPVMDELKKKGWELKTTYYEMDSFQIHQEDKILTNIQKASQFAGNEEQVSFVRACEQVFFDNSVINLAQIDLYEQMLARQEELTNLALVMDMLPNKGKDADYYTPIVSSKNHSELEISYGNLAQRLQEARGIATSIPCNKIITIFGSMEGRKGSYGLPFVLQSSDVPLMAYITKYYKQFSEETISGASDADMIMRAIKTGIPIEENVFKSLLDNCTDPEKLPPEVIWQHLDKFQELRRSNLLTALTPEFITTLPAVDQQFLHFFRTHDQAMQRFVLKNRDNFGEFFVNGLPTVACIESTAKKGDFDMIKEFITDDVLATFSPEDRMFWQTFRSLPLIGEKVLMEKREDYAHLFVDGKPTYAFLNILTDPAIVYQGKILDTMSIVKSADLSTFPEPERKFWEYCVKTDHLVTNQFLLTHKDDFEQLVVDGKPTEKLLDDALGENSYGVMRMALQNFDFTTLPESSRQYWEYISEQNPDLQHFFLSKPRDTYLHNGVVDQEKVKRDFINELRIRPELCSTYESLASLFDQLQHDALDSDQRGDVYMRIASAHRIRMSNQRTEVEAIPNLRTAFSGLWHADMQPYEQMCWKVLQRQLPFTANESQRDQMREQALVVENLDRERLNWVHESVHNYASVHEVPYLKAFRNYLQTGDRTELDTYSSLHSGVSKAPLYTDEDRAVLQQIPDLGEQLDQMIADASQFYEIHPETLSLASGDFLAQLQGMSEIGELNDACAGAEIMLKNLQGKHILETEDDKNTAILFVQHANKAREEVQKIVDDPRWKVQGLVLDTVLDDLTQKVLTQYKDYLENRKDTVSTSEILEAAGMVGETLIAAHYNGEVAPEALKTAKKLRNIADGFPAPVDIHALRLLLPVVKQQDIEAHWQRFSQACAPEMISMLVRTGMSQEEAEKRVAFTDLVEFRKSTTAYLLDPLMDRMEALWEDLDSGELEKLPTPESLYENLLGDQIVQGYTEEESVATFIKELQMKGTIPVDLNEASQFLSEIGRSTAADAEKLACRYVPGYEQKSDLERYPMSRKIDGKNIDFYPISYYGIDMIVIVEDGKLVEDPKEFMVKNFKPSKVAMDLLREGD